MPIAEADLLLVDRVRDGDAGAWAELIARFEGRLLAFVESRLHDRSASEDVVQEAFLGLLLSLPNYDPATPLESFLFAITAHKLTDALRRHGRRPRLTPDPAAGPSARPGLARAASSLVRSGEHRHREAALVTEVLRDFVEACQRQGQYERLACVELLFVLGWSNKSVAEQLGVSEQAVANHKQAAVVKLKEAIRRAHLDASSLTDLA